MNDLIKQVTDKTGITPEQSKSAVNTVIGYLKNKVPALGGQLDGLLSGNPVDAAKSKTVV